ncbi:MAG TPA: hypothetical protein VNZ64_28085 [Candidatus Acidoferrum sp.]|nr:hypothetical protein [Candidatus Acidoferrum sp.]
MTEKQKEHHLTSTSSDNMSQKTAIITGGSRGTGRNTAINLAGRGREKVFPQTSSPPFACEAGALAFGPWQSGIRAFGIRVKP